MNGNLKSICWNEEEVKGLVESVLRARTIIYDLSKQDYHYTRTLLRLAPAPRTGAANIFNRFRA